MSCSHSPFAAHSRPGQGIKLYTLQLGGNSPTTFSWPRGGAQHSSTSAKVCDMGKKERQHLQYLVSTVQIRWNCTQAEGFSRYEIWNLWNDCRNYLSHFKNYKRKKKKRKFRLPSMSKSSCSKEEEKASLQPHEVVLIHSLETKKSCNFQDRMQKSSRDHPSDLKVCGKFLSYL